MTFVNTFLGLPTPWDQLTGFQQTMVLVLLAFGAWVMIMAGLVLWRGVASWRQRRRLARLQHLYKSDWPLL